MRPVYSARAAVVSARGEAREAYSYVVIKSRSVLGLVGLYEVATPERGAVTYSPLGPAGPCA